MKRNKQRQQNKQRRAKRRRDDRTRAEKLEQALAAARQEHVERMAGDDDDAKLTRHWFFFGKLGVACPPGVSHDQLREAAAVELVRRSGNPASVDGLGPA